MEKESISVIGMGCRFPGGANNLNTFWDLLISNHSAIGEIPPDRWNVNYYYSEDQETPGKMYTKKGGFIDIPVNKFDANFFNIPPKEACNLDPQQRLALEVCYEAIEDAFLIPKKLKNSNTGVFLGMSYDEYNLYRKNNVFDSYVDMDAYSLTGANFSCAAGRISFSFGLEGPCMAIDTACSASLVAVHQAKLSLLSGECDLAFAIGVNIILNPDQHVSFCKLKALSSDGLCKTFDAKADGYVRSEGCGVVLLKRTSDAKRDHNRIRAIIKGSSVNQDGTSDSFTSPSQEAQEKNMIKAFEDAGIKPESVEYIEAHGTGTPLGDIVELEAIGNVAGKKRTQNKPLYIGSVKTNIGHLEPAAGIAGLIKVILSMEKGWLPANLNFSQPNPGINWTDYNLLVPTQNMLWDREKPILAGINSFGFSGTNVHIVVESYNSDRIDAIQSTNRYKEEKSSIDYESILCVSAKSSKSLKSIINQYVEFLKKNQHEKLSDICYSAYVGRAHYLYRYAVVCNTHDELIENLSNYQNQIANSGQKSGNLKQRQSAVFFGNGDIYWGDTFLKELFEISFVFRETLIHCDDVIQGQLGISVWRDCILSKSESRINRDCLKQLFVFMVEYSILKTLGSLGLRIQTVVGTNPATEYAFRCFKSTDTIKDSLSELCKIVDFMNEFSNIRSFEDQTLAVQANHTSLRVESNTKSTIQVKDIFDSNALTDYVKVLNQNTYHFVDIESGLISQNLNQEIANDNAFSCLGSSSRIGAFFIKMYYWGCDLDSLYPRDEVSRFVDIPTYAFDRKEFWLKVKSKTHKSLSPFIHRNVSSYDFPIEVDSELVSSDWNDESLEDVFKNQIELLTNQISDAVGCQLNTLKNKWMNKNLLPKVHAHSQIEVWSSFDENVAEGWKMIFIHSVDSLENPTITDAIIKKIASKGITPQRRNEIKLDGKPIHRIALICKSFRDAKQVLTNKNKKQIIQNKKNLSNSATYAFMFTGLGEQYEMMGIGLYQAEPSFRDTMDHCFKYIKDSFGFDLKNVIFTENNINRSPQKSGFDLRAMLRKEEQSSNIDEKPINRILYAHTSILILQFALGKLLMTWGIKPAYLIGHSLGEYAAACFADVLSIEDAIYLVVKRAEIIEKSINDGRMLAVSLSSVKMKVLLIEIKMEETISISLVNSPQSVVVSGSLEAINKMEIILTEKQISYRLLRSLRGFHSHMFDPIRDNLLELFSSVKFRKNKIPYVSNVTGDWITVAQCIDPDYWVRHTCSTVQFAQGIETLLKYDLTHLIEVGPGNSLCSFIAQNPLILTKHDLTVLPTMTGLFNKDDDDFFFKKMLARIWADGGEIWCPFGKHA